MSKEEKAKEKKTSDKSKKKKQGKIAKWFKDLKSEFKKVVWPTKKKVFNNTLVVLVVMVISSAFVGGLDYGLLKLFSFVLNLG
ncbi:preprotein translocase subunit SecE [Porcipelethomonas sp.]|uniref:preprotein translocase subunit SecE n=1 Tax=Porcipelethomonas sp. TaxID=2981675 RepID=UPI003EF21AD7